jgi:hypothetical protein
MEQSGNIHGLLDGYANREQLGESSLYPRSKGDEAIPSENGRHVVKLMLNGAWRGVSAVSLLFDVQVY